MKASGSRRFATPASRAIWRAILTKKRKDLSAKEDKLIGWKEEKEDKLTGWKPEYDAKVSPSAQDITKRHAIILVEEMERAYQYFELNDFLLAQELLQMSQCVPEEFIDNIVDLIEADAIFKKLDIEDIHHALRAVDWELQFQHCVTDAPSDDTNESIFNFNDEMMTTANESEPVQLMNKEYIFKKVQRHMDYYLNPKPVLV